MNIVHCKTITPGPSSMKPLKHDITDLNSPQTLAREYAHTRVHTHTHTPKQTHTHHGGHTRLTQSEGRLHAAHFLSSAVVLAGGAGRLWRCRFLILHQRELLPPVGELAEGVGAGEGGGTASPEQRKHVVHYFAQTHVSDERKEQPCQNPPRHLYRLCF